MNRAKPRHHQVSTRCKPIATANATASTSPSPSASPTSSSANVQTGQPSAPAPSGTTPDGRHRPRPLRPIQRRSARLAGRINRISQAPGEVQQEATTRRQRQHQLLFSQLQQGTTAAARLRSRNALVCQNLALVHKVANRQSHRSGVAFDDLCSAGYEGLIRAVDNFDSRSGNAFSSFAVPHIHGAMLMDQRDRQQPLQTPRRLRELQRRSDRLQDERRANGLAPLAPAALADTLGCPLAQLQEAGRVQQALRMRSLDEPRPGSLADGDDAWLQEMAAAPLQGRELEAEDPQLRWLRQQLQQLPSGDRELLEGRWIDGLSWSTLGQLLGCSSQHCRRRALELIARLQAMANPLQSSIASTAAIAV